jgi:hypothetical protein
VRTGRGAVVFVATALLGPLVLAVGVSAQGHRSQCQRLAGKDLAPARAVKLVERRKGNGERLLTGCVLPRGRVRPVVSETLYKHKVVGYRLRATNGATVLFHFRSTSQLARIDELGVVSVRTGRSYLVSRTCIDLDVARRVCSFPGFSNRALAVRINGRGQAIAAVELSDPGMTAVRAFSSYGSTDDLDSGRSEDIPPTSLRLKDRLATWTHAGETRSTILFGRPLAGPAGFIRAHAWGRTAPAAA